MPSRTQQSSLIQTTARVSPNGANSKRTAVLAPERVLLSTPHLSGEERTFVDDAFATNWVAPLGPHVDGFEREFAEYVGAPHAVALSSGTAALHLAIRLAGVSDGDEVITSTLTFCASVNPIIYERARPIFIDSEARSWNLDPNIVEDVLSARAQKGRLPKAIVVVHLYGQAANMSALMSLSERYEVPLIEDAAEALGSTYGGRFSGVFGQSGVFSFNGNKIITTSGGGMLVTDNADLARQAKKLATQAREDAPHYEHLEIGHNYRMSNVLAAIGRGQLRVIEDRIDARRGNFAFYRDNLSDLPGLEFMPEAAWGRSTRWLTALTIDPDAFGADRETVRLALDAANIEARPVWKPMHAQPAYAQYEAVGGAVADNLFERGLCLPSGSNLTEEDLTRVVDAVRSCCS